MTLKITALWDALGWAILHSFWQAALIGLIVWGLRALATERRAKLRYLFGMGGLVATFSLFLATFAVLALSRLQSGQTTLSADAGSVDGFSDLGLSVSVLPSTGFDAGMATAMVPWLGMVWAVGFAFLSLQAYRAWANTRWLASTGLRTPGPDWTERFSALVMRSRTHEKVRLFVSDHVKGPLTLGALRPIVLVPAGFLTALPPEQVEAILLHELAHIRRHDFLFGLVQTAIRTVLYFNPTVLILSRLVDTDREQACDDMAVQISGRPVDLVKGLAALRLASQAPDLTMAADGGPLLERLNRLMGRPVPRSTPNRLSAVAISALMLGSVAYSTVSVAHPHPTPPEAPKAPVLILPDTVIRANGWAAPLEAMELPPMPEMPEPPEVPEVPAFPVPSFMDYDNEEAFEAAMEAWGERMERWGETFESQYEGDWEKQMEAWGEEMEDWGEAVEALAENFDALSEDDLEVMGIEIDVLGEELGLAIADSVTHIITPKSMQAEVAAEIAKERAAVRARAAAERTRAAAERERAKHERTRASQERERARLERARAQEGRVRAEAERQRAYQERERARIERDRARHQANIERHASLQAHHSEFSAKSVRTVLLKQLAEDGLIPSGSQKAKLELSTENRLSVNGKRQSQVMGETYRELLGNLGVDCDATVKISLSEGKTSMSIKSETSRTRVEITE